jgi:hypothetical protein
LNSSGNLFANAAFFQPVCGTSYNALGTIAFSAKNGNPSSPGTSYGTCVHDRCVTQCDVGELVWHSDGNGLIYSDGVVSPGDASAYLFYESADSISSNSFIVIPSADSVDTYKPKFLCIKKYAND